MANKGSIDALKTEIDAKIYENDNQEITGDILNEVLKDTVDTIHGVDGVSISQNTESVKKINAKAFNENLTAINNDFNNQNS